MRFILGKNGGGNVSNATTSNTGDMTRNNYGMIENAVRNEMARQRMEFMPGQLDEYDIETENRRGVPGTGPYSRRRRRYFYRNETDDEIRDREMGYLANHGKKHHEQEEDESKGYGEETSIKSVVGKMLHKKMEQMKEDILEEVGEQVSKPVKEILHKKLTPIMEHLKELEENIEELKQEKKKMKKKEREDDKDDGDD